MKGGGLSLALVHDGNISNRNQVRALASGLSFVSSHSVEYDLSKTTVSPVCDSLVLGCGRRAAAAVAQLQRANNKVVQILHPRWPITTPFFDCLVLPHHDRLGWFDDNDKIVRMHGSLSWGLRREALRCYSRAEDKLNRSRPRIGVLLGGETDFPYLSRELEHLGNHAEIAIVASRRTPPELVSDLARSLGDIYVPGQSSSMGKPNPYRRILATSDAFIVSADSISMISDVIAVMGERQLTKGAFLLPAGESMRNKHRLFVDECKERFYRAGSKQLVHMFTSADQVIKGIAATYQVERPISIPYEADRVASLVAAKLGLSLGN